MLFLFFVFCFLLTVVLNKDENGPNNPTFVCCFLCFVSFSRSFVDKDKNDTHHMPP